MMPLQIFVEDQLNEPYEILARKALGLSVDQYSRSEVRASIVEIEEFISLGGLLELVTTSHASGYDCVIFIMDEETLFFSPERQPKLRAFREAFSQLCDYLNLLPDQNPLRVVNVIRIVCKRCLESWLATDPIAIIDSVRSGRGVNYNPGQRNTENMTPQDVARHIAHIIQEVGRRTGRRDLQRTSSKNVKRRGKAIAKYIEPDRARQFNRSLAYYFDIINCELSGCDHQCPE
jgi:hypothetical protein